jgi:hypothetical protein
MQIRRGLMKDGRHPSDTARGKQVVMFRRSRPKVVTVPQVA